MSWQKITFTAGMFLLVAGMAVGIAHAQVRGPMSNATPPANAGGQLNPFTLNTAPAASPPGPPAVLPPQANLPPIVPPRPPRRSPITPPRRPVF
jgi:hypothetical protein